MTTFQQYQHNQATVLRPEGKLNMIAAPQLRQHIADTVGNGQARLVIDLSATEFIDSSGLGALVAGLLRIACPGEQALLVLDLTSMTSVLHPYPTVDDASQ